MGQPQSIYMWKNVDKIILRNESQNDLISKITDLQYPQYCSKENEKCSLKASHIIGKFVQMKKSFQFTYGSKANFTSITELFSKLEVVFIQDQRIRERHVHHWAMNSYLVHKKLTNFCTMYLLKQKNICDYDIISIMSSDLMFD